MAEILKKKSVQITLIDSGLSPPIYILASFTSPPWEPHEMKFVGIRREAYDNPNVEQVVHTFWALFDIGPGVWEYRFRVGMTTWFVCNHLAETVTDRSGERFNILRVAAKGPAKVQSPAPLPNWSKNTCFISESDKLPTSSSDSWSSTDQSRSSFVTNPFSSSPAPTVRERCNKSDTQSDTPKSDEDLDRLLYEASSLGSEAITESSKSSDSRASVDSKDNHGGIVACWQSVIAWTYGIFAKVFRRSSNA